MDGRERDVSATDGRERDVSATDGRERDAAVDVSLRDAPADCEHSICGNGANQQQEDSDDANRDHYDGCSDDCRASADHLLISEVAVRPGGAEMIELMNPTKLSIELSDYLLSDSHLYYKVALGTFRPPAGRTSRPAFPPVRSSVPANTARSRWATPPEVHRVFLPPTGYPQISSCAPRPMVRQTTRGSPTCSPRKRAPRLVPPRPSPTLENRSFSFLSRGWAAERRRLPLLWHPDRIEPRGRQDDG